MKKFLTILAVMILSMTSPALADDKKDDVIVTVNGMTCQMCVNTMQKVFGKEDGVKEVAVDLDTQTLTIDMEDGTQLTDEKIKELVEWGGFDFIEVKR